VGVAALEGTPGSIGDLTRAAAAALRAAKTGGRERVVRSSAMAPSRRAEPLAVAP